MESPTRPRLSSASVESETEVATAEAPVRPGRSDRHRRRRAYQHPLIALMAVTAIAAGVRFYHLSSPPSYVFDEVYYAKDACFDAGFSFRECKLKAPGEQTFTVHPPLGRWIIAAGEKAYGNRPFGWRVASAVAGTMSVLLLAILALRLFGSGAWAGVAGLLLATESLHFVQSRIAMVDIFVTTFLVAGFLFLVLDRQWIERRTAGQQQPPEEEPDSEFLELPPDRPPAPIFRPWRIASGLAFGMAAASKWSGIPPLVVAILLSFAWERSRRKGLHLERPFFEAIRDESFGIFCFFVLLAIAVYMASYVNWFVANGFDLGGWWDIQRGMASFSLDLRAKHPYASRAWTWMVMERPVAYYYRCIGPAGRCLSAEILAIGNPVIFWGSVLALPYTLVAGIRRKDWRAALIVSAFSIQYFPWFLAARTSFFFYMAPATPFMVLAFVYLLRDAGGVTERLSNRWRSEISPVATVLVLLAVAAFVFFFPVLIGTPISHSAWQARMWFRGWI